MHKRVQKTIFQFNNQHLSIYLFIFIILNSLNITQHHETSRYIITCQRGSAAVVRTSCCSCGIHQMLHLSRAENTEPINTKFWTNDYLGDIKGIAKFGWDRFKGSVSPSGWNVQFSCFFLSGSSFRLQTTICNGFWCNMAQKIRFGESICLLSIRSFKS